MADINRIKVVLAEKKRTGKWLAPELGKRSGYGVEVVYEYLAA